MPGFTLSPTDTILYTGTHQSRAGTAEADPPSAKIPAHLADLGTNLVTIMKAWKLLGLVYGRKLPLWEPE